jgi:RNA polymerase sigma factor (sigma-70 family)
MRHLASSLLARLRGSLQLPPDQITDAELLARFVRSRDAAAFELLFWRHGPMVRGVCQRVLGNTSDTEDAFQATFVVLTRKAGSVGSGTAFAGWLHRVAWRTALNARKARGRRTARERRLGEFPELPARDDPARQAMDDEVQRVLDGELARLPEKLRLPLVLCDLEGRSHAAAAAELRCPLGTLNSRLARARERIRGRLLRKAIPSAGLVAALRPPAVSPDALMSLSRSPSVTVLALARATMRSLTLAAVGKLAGALAACGLVVAGLAFGATSGKEEPSPVPVVAPHAAAEPRLIDPDAGPLPAGAVARIGSLRFRHTGVVTGLLYSPDGKWLASVSTDSSDATARLWDAETGKERFRVAITVRGDNPGREPDREPRALGFSADSRRFLVVDAVSVRAFDTRDGKELSSSKHTDPARNDAPLIGAAVAPGGETVVLARLNGRHEIRDTATGELRVTGEHPFHGRGNHVLVVFSPDGRRFLFAGQVDHSEPVFDSATGKQTTQIRADNGYLNRLQFLPDGKSIVGLPIYSTLEERPTKDQVTVFAADTGRILRKIDVDGASTIAVSPDGKLLVTGNAQKGGLRFLDFESGKEVGQIKTPPSLIHLAFAPSGKWLAGTRATSGTISVWNVRERRNHPASPEPAWYYGTVFTPDGRGLVLPQRGLSQRGRPLIDWRTGSEIRRLANVEPDGRMDPILSPDLRIYAVRDQRGPIRLLDAETGREVRTLTGHPGGASSMVFSRDGRRLASCGWDKVIRVWNTADGREIAHFAPPEMFGSDDLALSADGRVLAVSFTQKVTNGNVLYSWNVEAGAQLARIEAPNWFFSGVALSPDGRFLAGGGGRDRGSPALETPVILWDATTGRVTHSLQGHSTAGVRPGAHCSFSPDSRWLVTGDPSGRLRLWEVSTGQEVLRFEGHHSTVLANFSPDGRLLVAASEDAPCLIWDVTGRSPAGRLTPETLSPARLEECRAALHGNDARAAYQALWTLVAAPRQSVPFLAGKLRPVEAPEPTRLSRLVAGLDADAFSDREQAEADLAKLGETVEPALRKLSKASPSAEVRRRSEALLMRIAASPERLYAGREIAVLEYTATSEARRLLESLAGGLPGAGLTTAAGEALKRFNPPFAAPP